MKDKKKKMRYKIRSEMKNEIRNDEIKYWWCDNENEKKNEFYMKSKKN